MHFTSSIFIIFFSLSHALNSGHFQSPRMLNSPYVTKSGNIPINLDGAGYYVNADLAWHYNDASEDNNSDNSMVYMTIALYTSQTILVSSCFDFMQYDCERYNCTNYTSDSSTPVFPDFEVSSGSYAKANLYLDYEYWELNTNATLASDCSGETYSNLGLGRYGILGLGRSSPAEANFLKSPPTFSVYLDPCFGESTLLFEKNTNITTNSSLVGSLQTNADWNIFPDLVIVRFSNFVQSWNFGLIFDLNANGIGVPLFLFNSIIQTLISTGIVNCNNATYSPTCHVYRSGDETPNLPTLTLTIQDVSIAIPPDLYFSGDFNVSGNTTVIFNFRALDSSLLGLNYVTNVYQDYIIFDRNFMSYYYTEFSFNNTDNTEPQYTVTLYKPNFRCLPSPPSPVNPPNPSVWPWIAGGICSFLVIVGLILFWIRRCRNNRVNDKTRSGNESYKSLVDDSSQWKSYLKHKEDYASKYGQESWIRPDLPGST